MNDLDLMEPFFVYLQVISFVGNMEQAFLKQNKKQNLLFKTLNLLIYLHDE
jgi:hypothetical protein